MCADSACPVGAAPIAIDRNFFPLFLRHVRDTRKTRVQKQEQFSWRGRALYLRQKDSNAIAVYLEASSRVLRGRGYWEFGNQQKGSAEMHTNSSKLANAHVVSVAATNVARSCGGLYS